MVAVYYPGVITTVLNWDIGAPAHTANVLHWLGQPINYSIPQLGVIRGEVDTAIQAGLIGLIASVNKYLGCSVIDSGSALGAEEPNDGFPPVAGGGAATPVGDQVAFLLSFKTQHRYKGGHGRMYLGGVDTIHSNADGRTWNTAAIGNYQTYWDQLKAAMAAVPTADGGPLKPIIWHKKWKANPNSVEDIIDRIAQPVYATQRRRVRKVSRHRKETVMAAARAEVLAEYSILHPVP